MLRASLPMLLGGVVVLAFLLAAAAPSGGRSEDPGAGSAGYATLKAEAEKYFAEGSYARAHELYEKVKTDGLPAAAQRWVAFRRADCQWRSQVASQQADQTRISAAVQQLQAQLQGVTREADRDRTWAETQESLGDYYWLSQRNWGGGWQAYQQALDWYAGSPDIDWARERYLGIVRRAAGGNKSGYEPYAYWVRQMPIPVMENAIRISQTPADVGLCNYIFAGALQQQGDPRLRNRVPGLLDRVIALGKQTEWYDDALYDAAQWWNNVGLTERLANGAVQSRPDYVKAVELLRRFIAEFQKGETAHYDEARNLLRDITSPAVGLGVSNTFLPGSFVEYSLSWRNVKEVQLGLYPITLIEDPHPDPNSWNWIDGLDLAGRKPAKQWTHATNDDGKHVPGSDSKRFDAPLEPRAYVLQAEADGKRARELVLVTEATIVLKQTPSKTLVYVCQALTGAPLPEAAVTVWRRYGEPDNHFRIEQQTGRTDKDGLVTFGVDKNKQPANILVTALSGAQQAYASTGGIWGGDRANGWRLYVLTDRPAYRPGDKAEWKIMARRWDGKYETPAGAELRYVIRDARGAPVEEKKITFNAFGSTWGGLELKPEMPLGEFRIEFYDGNLQVGNATLLRLEEYKLPEFKVTLDTPKDAAGNYQSYRVGDTLEISVQADYYFGGPVADADVQVLVYQRPYYPTWRPKRDYPWYYDDSSQNRWYDWYGPGQHMQTIALKTDAQGHATCQFATPASATQDFEYRLEARVTDSSRREIVANHSVRVTQQAYYVHLTPEHNVYHPHDQVTIDVAAVDANEKPQKVSGQVRISLAQWREVWEDPDGRRVERDARGDCLLPADTDKLPADPQRYGWRLVFRGYRYEELSTQTVETGTDGKAEVTFTPQADGYYTTHWESEDPGYGVITAEGSVWVGTGSTTALGYRPGGVQIIVDRDTLRVGHEAPLMLTTPTSDRYVLLTTEVDDLLSCQLVHVTGNAKLLHLPIGPEHVPNFYVSAACVSDAELLTDTQELVVPPVEQFINVEVTPDQQAYGPKGEGMLTVRTKDHTGKPLAAEVALRVYDEAVSYIQQDYAGDIRQFFYGEKRGQRTQLTSSFRERTYRKLREPQPPPLPGINDEDAMWDLNVRYEARLPSGGATAKEQMYGRRTRRLAGRGGGEVDRDLALADQLEVSELGIAAQAGVNRPAESASQAFFKNEDKKFLPEATVQVRSDFRATAFWQPDVVTDASGVATVKVTYPESLTTWHVAATAATTATVIGQGEASVQTRLPLIVRLQGPRFFLVGDTLIVSAVINNNLAEPQEVLPALAADGLQVIGWRDADERIQLGREFWRTGDMTPVTVPANGTKRIDWQITVGPASSSAAVGPASGRSLPAADAPGEARLKVSARGTQHADAMERTFPIYERGLDQLIAKSGKVRDGDVTVKLRIPAERRKDSTTLTVQVAPSMAATMLDALPYLVDYPYGCTEQTMSRFLPAVIVAKTLKDNGLDPAIVANKLFGGIDQDPNNLKRLGERNLARLDAVVQQSLERLYDFQRDDGGWRWWKDPHAGESDHFMTAYVVWGLALAQQADIELKPGVLDRGAAFLTQRLVEHEKDLDMQAWMLHALAQQSVTEPAQKRGADAFERKAFDNLYANRDRLNAYTRALLALAAHRYGFTEQAQVLVRNLENGVQQDAAPDTSVVMQAAQQSHAAVIPTAHWGEDGLYYRWSDGGEEATAFALQALLAIEPQHKLIEPVTNWLIKNRRGAQWRSTRDTAIVVLALNEYLKASGELSPEMAYEVSVNGHAVAQRQLTAADGLAAPSRIAIDRELIQDGENEIHIRRTHGNGPLYFAAEARFFSLEEPIQPAGNELFVRRQYYRLAQQPTLLKGLATQRSPLDDQGQIASGDRVEVVLLIESKNNYEYLIFEDLKPAGFEAVDVKSGTGVTLRELNEKAVARQLGRQPDAQGVTTPTGETHMVRDDSDFTGRTVWAHQELRDRKVALFVDHLPEGIWEVRYELRAETPGSFHALPVVGQAMYVPELRGNGAEVRVQVTE